MRMYPEDAIRELVANAVVHQDFSITGAGPMVEIFSDRMEMTIPATRSWTRYDSSTRRPGAAMRTWPRSCGG